MPSSPLDALPIGIIMFVGMVLSVLWRKYGRKRAAEELPALARELDLAFARSAHSGAQGRISGRHRGHDVFVDPEGSRAIVVRFNRSPSVELRSYPKDPRPRFGWVTAYSGDRDFDRFFKVRFASEGLARYLAASDRPSQYLEPFVGRYERQIRAVSVTSQAVTCELDFGNPPYIPAGAIRTLLPACIALAKFVESGVDESGVDEASVDEAGVAELSVDELAMAHEPAAESSLNGQPGQPGATFEAALRHQSEGRPVEAALAYRQVLQQDPKHAASTFRLGTLALAAGRTDTAVSLFERAVELDGANETYLAHWAQALRLLAQSHASRGHTESARVHYRHALALDPDDVVALLGLGDLLEASGSTDEAARCFRQALAREPDSAEAAARLLAVLRASGHLPEAIAHVRWCFERWDIPELHSVLVQSLSYVPGYDDAAILREARAWERAHTAGLEPRAVPFTNERDPDRRLRVAYLAPALLGHSQGCCLQPLLAHHDRQAVELSVYADGAPADPETQLLRGFADHFCDTSLLSDEACAERIRQDGIDVLVDLSMHAPNGRLLVFARKPAPVQCCWLAYPGTTGLSSMDYRLTDPYLDPLEVDRAVYAERSLVLPDSVWCSAPRSHGVEAGPLPASSAGFVTFGCLNDFVAINSAVLELWAQVLRAVQGSRLVLRVPPGDVRSRISSGLERAGVESERVSFVEASSREEDLAVYRQLDLCLDTFPCSGAASSLDALWMGVPVITLAGNTVSGRSGASIAMNLGLPEWIAATPRDYVEVAARWSADLERLSALRAQLRARMQTSPLMDGARFARNMEDAYRHAWRTWTGRRASDGSTQVLDHGSFAE